MSFCTFVSNVYSGDAEIASEITFMYTEYYLLVLWNSYFCFIHWHHFLIYCYFCINSFPTTVDLEINI